MNFLQRKITLLLLLSGLVTTLKTVAQTTVNERFGQNRVQYKDFIFQYYESDNFITHFYQGGQDVAKYTIKAAEDNADDIAKMLDYRLKKKIDIIVYNTINELNQTNIGIYEAGQIPGGTIKLPENKMFVYFNGDHRNLDKQIREGISNIYLDRMIKGSGAAEKIQNAVLLNLPDWYRLGLIKYIGEAWSSEMEDHLRDGILSGRYKKLNKLTPDEAVFVGNSIWHYIEETHGKTAVNNVIYLTRINRSVDNGFLFVLGTNLSQTLQEWYNFYLNRFNNESKISSLPPDSSIVKFKYKKTVDYYEPKLSADGKHIAIASNDMGRYKVHLINTEDGKKKVILRGGFRTNTLFTDQSIPLLAWDPSGKKLAMIKERRAQIFLWMYDLETGKKTVAPIRKFQKVVSFSFVDSKQLVMSATQNGQSDIYLYTIASTTTRKLTDDYFDDLDPAYISADGIRGIMFSSDREDDTVKPQRYESQIMKKQLDLFFYDLDANQNVLYRITNTPYANESHPQNFSDKEFCFLSDANGLRNRYTGHFETTFDHYQKTYRFVNKETDEEDSVQVRQEVPLDSAIDRTTVVFQDSSVEKVYKVSGVNTSYTNYTHSILAQSIIPSKNLTLDFFKIGNKPQLRKYPVDLTAERGKAPVMDYMLQLQRSNTAPPANPVENKPRVTAKRDSTRSNKGNRPFDFQSEFDYGVKLFDWDSAAATKMTNSVDGGYVFRFSKVRPYFVRFMVDKVVTSLDNGPIVTPYQPFTGYYQQPTAPDFGIKVGVTDLLEDYKLYGGVRLPFSNGFSNMEYFLTFENLKKRLDKKFTVYRGVKSSQAALQDNAGNVISTLNYSTKTVYIETELKYALDVLSSLRFNINFRNDVSVVKAQDTVTLNLPNSVDNWIGLRAEYVYDNTIAVMNNIRYGTRFRFFAEMYKEFPTKSKQVGTEADFPVPVFNKKVLGILGFDARYYLKIYKQIIWANRLSSAWSFGTAKMIYYLGGTEDWITLPTFNKFDATTPINYNGNYAFQTLAAPLRGVLQNARNGDKYVLLNSELRVPIFAALLNRSIKSEFVRNLTLVGFFDAGMAWEGTSPFSGNSPVFSQVLPNIPGEPSVIAKVQQYKSPIVMGFGPGIRTSILGFFLRLDVAWGYNTDKVSSKPIGYFSFGLDF